MANTTTYNPKSIEPKWQKYWAEHETFKTDVWDFSKPKYYALDMFPYPSGVGLHAGHPEGYTATDITSRMKRMQGYNVLHPMGYDSFGLPAEQYAVKTGNNPNGFTEKNIETFTKQLKELGFDYDWSKTLATSDPKFYKWTQWIFKQLYLDGYAKYIGTKNRLWHFITWITCRFFQLFYNISQRDLSDLQFFCQLFIISDRQ